MRKMLSMAMWMALIVAPVQALIGDAHGLNTLKHQPAKIAAIEGHWENPPGEATPLIWSVGRTCSAKRPASSWRCRTSAA